MESAENSLTSRIWVAFSALAVFYGAAFFFVHRADSAVVGPLHSGLHELPLQIGKWQGQEQELDEKIAKRVAAQDSVSRRYRRIIDEPDQGTPYEQLLSLHIASWNAVGEPTLPHPPNVCYPAVGAANLSEKSVDVGANEPIQASLMTVEREGRKSLVLYWYRWDDSICTTRWQATWARLGLAGRSSWPPVIKILLDMPLNPRQSSSQEAQAALIDFAGEVRKFTRNL